jgi:hypothetical protein
MGACFHTEVFDGKLTPKELEKAYNDRVEDLRSEFGSNAYNGTFSTLHGIHVETGTGVFQTQREAADYLDGVCEKWGNAIAVKYKDRREEKTKAPTFEGKPSKEYNCAVIINDASDCSYGLRCAIRVLAAPDYKRRMLIADQLTPAQKTQFVKAYEAWHTKHETARAAENTFREALNVVGTTKEPITAEMLKPLKSAGNQRHKLRTAADAAAARLKATDHKFAEKLYATKIVDHGEQWLVGGVCAE